MDFSSSNKRMQNARQFIVRTCRFILTSPVDRLIEELTIRGPLRRSPSKYKSQTPAIGAFINYCRFSLSMSMISGVHTRLAKKTTAVGCEICH